MNNATQPEPETKHQNSTIELITDNDEINVNVYDKNKRTNVMKNQKKKKKKSLKKKKIWKRATKPTVVVRPQTILDAQATSLETKVPMTFNLCHTSMAYDMIKRALYNVNASKWQKFPQVCNHKDCKSLLIESRYMYYCDVHNPQATGLEVKVSTIPNAGDGLFVASGYSFKNGDTIDIYDGVLLQTQSDPSQDSRYIFQTKHGFYIDAKSTKSCMARWINSDVKRLNVQFVHAELKTDKTVAQPIVIEAMRDIAAGEELFVDYGSDHSL